MAQKRMLSSKIIDSDAFLDMPQTSQLLYFHLAMRTDDDGFVGNPKNIMRMIGSANNDLTILFTKKFIIGFESGVIVIKHHRINNNWDSYNCKRTQYLEEFNKLKIKENGSYTLNKNDGLPIQTEFRLISDGNQSLEENRIEENRRDKNRIEEKKIYGEFKNVLLLDEEYNKLVEKIGNNSTKLLIEELSGYLKSIGKDKYKDHYATILNWARRKNQGSKTNTYKNENQSNMIDKLKAKTLK